MVNQNTQIQPKSEDHLQRWQDRLLPAMLGAIIFTTVFFLLVSLWVFYDFRKQVTNAKLDLTSVFDRYEHEYLEKGRELSSEYIRWKTVVLLEQELIARRYKQASSVILARIWTRYLGFLTGMTLALVGAFFVLGQLKTDSNTLQTSTSALKAELSTSSPGLVLATLGTVLMVISLVVTFEFETRDIPIYIQSSPPSTLHLPRQLPNSDTPSPDQKTPTDELIEAAPEPDIGVE